MKQSLKILLAYHKPDYLLKNSVFVPIHVGRELAMNSMDKKKIQWMLDNMLGDNTGENISRKNATYNEMTGIYWAWRNYDSLGNPDYVGFMHYRRHFIFDEKLSGVQYECSDIADNYYDKICYDEKKILNMLSRSDFICTKPHWRKSLYEQYKRNHEIEDLDTAVKIIKEKYPDFYKAAEKYLYGHDAYFCNMFIFPRDIFFQYASWFFDIVFELEKRRDITTRRLFLSEWLTGIFITYLIMQGKKTIHLPIMIAEGEHEIPVVMAADNDYAYPMMVAIASLLNSAKSNTTYKLYLLISEDFSEENIQYIRSICNTNSKCFCKFIKMGQSYSDIKTRVPHITNATYYRLSLPSFLSDVKKCLYLDVDIVVKKDLSAMFRTCIDDRYIAGVKALGYFSTEVEIEYHRNRLGIAYLDDYINAGVLIMNLEKMRNDKLEIKFMELLGKNFESQDQDILNVACFGKIMRLPFRYNVMTKYPLYNDQIYDKSFLNKQIEENEWNEGRKNPDIIHYADENKPWNNFYVVYSQDWWHVVETLPNDLAVKIVKKYLIKLMKSANEIEKVKSELRTTQKKLRTSLSHEAALKKSASFRIGRILTWLPRKFRGGIQCYKQHGMKYTVKRIYWHIGHLI